MGAIDPDVAHRDKFGVCSPIWLAERPTRLSHSTEVIGPHAIIRATMLRKFFQLFRKATVVIPGADKLPAGEARTIQLGDGLVDGKQILICRSKDGQVYALDTHCPHDEGGKLLPGPLFEGDKAVCPLHNFHFAVSSGKVEKGTCKAATAYNIKEIDGEFHITF